MDDCKEDASNIARQLRAYQWRTQKLYEVSNTLQQKEYALPAMLEIILAAAVEMSGAKYGALGLFEQDGRRFAQFFTAGMDEATMQAIELLPMGKDPVGHLVHEHKSVRLNDLAKHPDLVGRPERRPPMHSFLGVPIRVHHRLFGRIYLADKQGPETNFTPCDEQTIATLAIQAGWAVETNSLLNHVEASQSQYRALLESTSEGIYGVDLEGNCTFLNKAGAALLGYRAEDVIGRFMHELIHHTKQDGTCYPAEECPIYAAFRTGQACRLDNELLWRRDGTCLPVECSSSPLYEGGVLKGAVITFIDITMRKQAEMARQQSETRFQTLMDCSPAIIFLKDLEGRYLHVNGRFEQLAHRPCSDIIGKMDHELFPTEQAAAFRANDLTVLQAGRPMEFEEVALHDDGPHVSIVCKFPLHDATGAPYAVGGIVTDITERKRTEQALQESEQRFRQLAEAVHDVIWVSNRELTQILYVSPAYEAIWGQACQRLYENAESFLDAIHPEDRARVRATLMEKQRAQGQGFEHEYRIVRPDGSIRWIWDRGFPVMNKAGHAYRMAGIAEDITERKLAEAVRIQLLDKIMVAQEEERQRIARELHDETEQTLASLLIGLRAMEDIPTLEQVRHRAQALRPIAANALEELQRLVWGLRPSLLDELGLAAAISRLCEEFSHVHGIRVEAQVGNVATCGLSPMVETTLYRIAQEALTNTSKHATATVASVLIQPLGPSVRLVVEDNGCGFDLAKVRLAVGPAARLGLYGMQERAAIVGGTLMIESAKGQGTTICVEVPLASETSR